MGNVKAFFQNKTVRFFIIYMIFFVILGSFSIANFYAAIRPELVHQLGILFMVLFLSGIIYAGISIIIIAGGWSDTLSDILWLIRKRNFVKLNDNEKTECFISFLKKRYRWNAYELLDEINTQAVLKQLMAIIKEKKEDSDTIAVSAYILGMLGEKARDAKPLLQDLLTDEDYLDEKPYFAFALAKIDWRETEGIDALNALLEKAKLDDEEVEMFNDLCREIVINELEKIGERKDDIETIKADIATAKKIMENGGITKYNELLTKINTSIEKLEQEPLLSIEQIDKIRGTKTKERFFAKHGDAIITGLFGLTAVLLTFLLMR